jgi:hypothetical protein
VVDYDLNAGSGFGSWILILLYSSLTLKMSVKKDNFVAQFFMLPTFFKKNYENLGLKSQKINKILGIIDSDPEQDPDLDAYL